MRRERTEGACSSSATTVDADASAADLAAFAGVVARWLLTQGEVAILLGMRPGTALAVLPCSAMSCEATELMRLLVRLDRRLRPATGEPFVRDRGGIPEDDAVQTVKAVPQLRSAISTPAAFGESALQRLTCDVGTSMCSHCGACPEQGPWP